jgi:hypothetical protein
VYLKQVRRRTARTHFKHNVCSCTWLADDTSHVSVVCRSHGCVFPAWSAPALQIAMRTGAYPTRVDMCVVSNYPERVETLLETWHMPHVRVCGSYNTLNTTKEKYALVWEHREAVEKAYQEGERLALPTVLNPETMELLCAISLGTHTLA